MHDEGYVRCSHCRGFYEADRAKCKWCEYDTVFIGADDKPIVYPDRETVRAIQLAEFERLPEEAQADYMKPPADHPSLICGCLHCGPGGHGFEAIEMRWHPVEKMWCCPCTTCGGRGFEFDIHPLGPVRHCAGCDGWYTPDADTPKDAGCPACGCKEYSGLVEEDDLESARWELDDALALLDDVLDRAIKGELEYQPRPTPLDFEDDPLPWQADDEVNAVPSASPDNAGEDWQDDLQPWYPGKDEDDERDELGGKPRRPDDIDHPSPPLHRHHRPTDGPDDADDIPF